MFSVNPLVKDNLREILKEIAKIGYKGIEFSGYYKHTPGEIRKMLDDFGLVCPGTHTRLERLRGEWDRQVEIHKTLGAKFMIVPGGINEDLHDVERNAKMADVFSELAEKAKAEGLAVGYHAHGGDAKIIDGMTAWDRFFSRTSPEVVAQIDVGNYLAGGGDPYESIRKFPGRTGSIHLRDKLKKGQLLGEGQVDWKQVFELCETIGGTEWYIVEYSTHRDSLKYIEGCLENLRKMGKTD